MLYIDSLRPDTKKLFLLLAKKNRPYDLAGGTALALHIGHRESIDLDFVVYREIQDTDITALKKIDKNYQILYQSNEQIDLLIQGVKVTLFSYWRKPLYPYIIHDHMNIWGLMDIAISKASTIGRRSEIKDYIDLYILLSEHHITLKKLIIQAQRKLQGDFSPKLFLKQLLLIDSCEDVDIAMSAGRSYDRHTIDRYFRHLVIDFIVS